MPDRNHYAGAPGDLILHENRNYLNHTVNMDSGVLASGIREGWLDVSQGMKVSSLVCKARIIAGGIQGCSRRIVVVPIRKGRNQITAHNRIANEDGDKKGGKFKHGTQCLTRLHPTGYVPRCNSDC